MTFDEFYALYPRKVAPKVAARAWAKLKPDVALQAKIEAALKWQIPEFRKRLPKHVPHPATWLNQGRWDDEPDTKQAAPQDAPPQQGSKPVIPSACFRCGRTGTPKSRIGKSWNYACNPFCEYFNVPAQPPRPPAA